MSNMYENIPISREESEISAAEKDRPIEYPIIDIVRHGETEYKEMTNPDFVFDPNAPEFKLTSEYLDLTEPGIENIRKTAEQLRGAIDKDSEVVLIVSSPNYRAQSSALIIAETLQKAGVMLLSEQPRTANALHQIQIRDSEDIEEWMDEALKYRAESVEQANEAPNVAHHETAKRMGRELGELMSEDYDDIPLRFNRFLRHYSNIRHHLSPEMKKSISDKRLRIISITHEEVPTMFMQEIMGSETNLQKAQVLEIRPESGLHKANEAIDAEVELMSKADEGGRSHKAYIKRSFKRP